MSTKIEKQKKIFSLLNDRFANLLEGSTELLADEAGDEAPDEQARVSRVDVLGRVYHFYRSIIQNLTSGLITIDLDGEITFVNRTVGQLLGYEVEELLSKQIQLLFDEEKEFRLFMQQLSSSGKRIDEKEVVFRKKNGEKIIVELNASPIHDENNNFEGIVLLFRDLTEIHQLKKQVERMERLALLGELAAGIAHEIRNPLGGIKTAAQVLEESFGVDDFRLQLIQRIVREVDKANRLLQEFFKFAKPTKPQLAFHNIEMIIDGVYLLLAPKLQKRNIKFSASFAENVPQVYVDETQIEQVILNLFLNSIDAMPEGGELRVNTRSKKLRILDKERENLNIENHEVTYVIVEISDTGIGIPEQHIEKIFNPFFTTKTDGVGLGLSICSRLIEENGGKIDVVRGKEKGATFILAIPAFIHR